jgi:hypothetical protein
VLLIGAEAPCRYVEGSLEDDVISQSKALKVDGQVDGGVMGVSVMG